jgi:hypothetical protein
MADHSAAGDVFGHGYRGASRNGAKGLKTQGEPIGRRKPPLEMGRQTVGRHDVEADAWEQHYLRRFGLMISGGEGFEHPNFARNIQVMNAGS